MCGGGGGGRVANFPISQFFHTQYEFDIFVINFI